MTSRLFGEVEMDFLDATFYKQGLQQSETWEIASAAMREFLKPAVKASRALSRKHNKDKPAVRKQIVANLQEDYGVAEKPKWDDRKDDDGGDGTKPDQKKDKGQSVKGKLKTIINEDELVLEDGTVIPITLCEMLSGDRINTPFDLIYDDALEDQPELQVVVYTDHPLFKGKDSQETIRILATAEAIFRVLVEYHQMKMSEAFNIKNEWIMKRLEVKGQ